MYYQDAHEIAVEQFLRDNDPLYTARSKNLKMEYPYLTQRQVNLRASKEIPTSNLSNKQKLQCLHMDGVVFDPVGKQ